FLANIQPDLQRTVREQCSRARFVAMDSMNLWINIAHEPLVRTIRSVDCLMLNDEELEQLTGRPTMPAAAREVLTRGPSAGAADRAGDHGARRGARADLLVLRRAGRAAGLSRPAHGGPSRTWTMRSAAASMSIVSK